MEIVENNYKPNTKIEGKCSFCKSVVNATISELQKIDPIALNIIQQCKRMGKNYSIFYTKCIVCEGKNTLVFRIPIKKTDNVINLIKKETL